MVCFRLHEKHKKTYTYCNKRKYEAAKYIYLVFRRKPLDVFVVFVWFFVLPFFRRWYDVACAIAIHAYLTDITWTSSDLNVLFAACDHAAFMTKHGRHDKMRNIRLRFGAYCVNSHFSPLFYYLIISCVLLFYYFNYSLRFSVLASLLFAYWNQMDEYVKWNSPTLRVYVMFIRI